MSNDTVLVSFMRRALIALLIFGLLGTEVELVLLKHTDGFWQLVPVIAVGLAILVSMWCAVSPSTAALGTLRVIMSAFLLVGIAGVVQHFTGNIGYEKESNPGLSGLDLYKSAAMGTTPLLAPGVMVQLGLLGLLYAFRHPVFHRNDR